MGTGAGAGTDPALMLALAPSSAPGARPPADSGVGAGLSGWLYWGAAVAVSASCSTLCGGDWMVEVGTAAWTGARMGASSWARTLLPSCVRRGRGGGEEGGEEGGETGAALDCHGNIQWLNANVPTNPFSPELSKIQLA